jgi:hypothetical protein
MDRTVSQDQCQTWKDTQKYTTPGRRAMEMNLELNATTSVFYETVGGTDLSRYHVDCRGGVFYVNDKEYHHMVVAHYVKITVIPLAMTISAEGQVTDDLNQLALPCHKSKLGCVTKQGTYLWDLPVHPDDCPLFLDPLVGGNMIKDNLGIQRFLSTDNSMVRLKLIRKISMCEDMVWETNYQDLFLLVSLTHPMFLRDIHPSEISITPYSNNKDQFMYGVFSDKVMEEITAME